MSLSKPKRVCVGSDSQKIRQSFDERICDDLCEVILQYLTLKDKLRLESVSKQFRRTIFQRQDHIWITSGKGYSTAEMELTDKHFYSKYKFNLKAFESVLKKCPNIKSVVINTSYSLWRRTSVKVVELIDKYCNNLSQFNSGLAFDEISWNQLIKTINSKTFTLILEENKNFKIDLKSLSFVEELKIIAFGGEISINDIKDVNNIISVRIDNIESENQFKDFKTFAENNKRLKSLKIPFHRLNMKFNESIHSFNIISKLKHLNHFEFTYNEIYWSDSDDISFAECLQQIAVNCVHLKSISCSILKIIGISDIIPSFKVFNNLKRLKLWLYSYDSFSFKLLNGFEGLTHLTLENDKCCGISLKGIKVFLPKLRFLSSNDIELTKSNIKYLYGLKDLEVIDLSMRCSAYRKPLDEKSGKLKQIENDIIKNSPKIKTIQLFKDYR